MKANAVILLSGGLDSATALAVAANRDEMCCHTLAIDYGQRHRAELAAASTVSGLLGAETHRVVSVDLRSIGGSALTDDIDVPEAPTSGIPITYVPARNTVFLSVALGLAETLDASAIYVGVNAVDYSGYPDCRPEFIEAYQALANVATKAGVGGRGPAIHAPLIELTKGEIIRLGTRLGVDYGATVSCYQADAEGRACGRCDSCRIRRAGFEEAEISDPTRYVESAE